MSGTTGSPIERRGYKDAPTSNFSGQDAMKEFRRVIINWRKNIKKKKHSFSDYAVKLYNLFDEEVYTVFITNFQMEKKQPILTIKKRKRGMKISR